MWGGHSCPPLLILLLPLLCFEHGAEPPKRQDMNSQPENPIDSSIPPDEAAPGASSSGRALADTALTEDLALALFKRPDLPSDDIEQISRDSALMKSRKVRLAVAAHPRAPRRLTLRLVRELYTFDLMQFSLLPAVPADLKRVAEQQLVARLASITLGERLSLARRSASLVAAALLLDKESPV